MSNAFVNSTYRGPASTPMVEGALAEEPESMNTVIKEIPLGEE